MLPLDERPRTMLSALLGLLQAQEGPSRKVPLEDDPVQAVAQRRFEPASRLGGGCMELTAGSFPFLLTALAILAQGC